MINSHSARILFLIFLVIKVYDATAGTPKPVAQSGIIDFRSVPIEDKIFPLQGEFEFYWKKFLTPDSFTTRNPASKKFSGFPEIWKNQVYGQDTISAMGYGTYRFQIILPATYNKNEWLGIGLADLYTSYKLFIDGKEVAANGVVATSENEYTPFWLPQVATFIPSNDTVNVILQIANFKHAKGGSREALIFGKASALTQRYQHNLDYDFILFGCVLMGGLFFLGLYFFSRNEISLLWFSMFCITYSYRFIGAKNYGLHQLFTDIPWTVTIHLEYFMLYFSAFVFGRCTFQLYPEVSSKLIIRIFSASTLILTGIVVVAPTDIFTNTLIPFFVLLGLYIPIFMGIYIKATLRRLDGAIFALLSTGAIVFSFSYDILAYLGLFEKNNIVIFFSYFAFFFLQSLILSYRFAKSYQRALAKAEMASLAKMEFLSTMSHEIRTPLNAIVGMSNLIAVAPSQTENLETLKFASRHLMFLINDILDYSKIDAGKIEFEKEPANVRELMKKLVAVYRERAVEKKNQILTEIDEAIPDLILCDSTRLNQIISNLVSNAIKFTDQGIIRICLRKISGDEQSVSIRFSVEDTGIGIAPEQQGFIFENFSQASSSTTRKFGGTGLGLTITQKLLELQGVKIQLSSEEGQGSCFFFTQTFEIPARQETEPERSSERIISADVLAGKKILLVEDNPVNVLIASKFLQKWNVQVDVAESGMMALDKFSDHELVLMDLEMPEMDGFTTTYNLRKKGINVPIIALTASALIEVKEKVLQSGMNDFVTKPFDPQELFTKIASHLVSE